jgi:tetratricopeptide (TPR) repeat protein
MLRIMSRLGIYYHLSGEYEKAIATNQEAIATYNDSIAPGNVVIAYGEQANLYAELGMYDQALEMNKKAQYYSMLKDSFGLGDLYRYRAQIFRNMNQKDSVFHYLRLGEKLSMIQNSFKGVFVNKVETVNSYLDYPDSLEKALQLALSICPDTVRMPQWAKYQLNLHLGRALLQTGKEQNGIHLIDRAAQDLINMKFMEGRDANEILMDYYLAKGMNDDFARCYIRNRQFADSLDNNEKKRAVAAANIRFDANQKEKENKLLSAQVQWQQQQLFYNICISITLLLLLITTTAYFIIRRKANHQLIENNKREIQTLIARQQGLNRRNEQLTEEIERAMATNNLNSIRQLTVQSLLSREDENAFRRSFATIHPSYLPKLRESYPQLTRNEELLAMLICMNQSTDEIALIMGINRNSVNVVRSRMRKNMELPKEKSLDEVLKQYLT